MICFRDSWPSAPEGGLTRLVEYVLSPGNFYTAPGLVLEWEIVPAREQRWELFRGRLLDAAHTRQVKTFEEWNILLIENGVRSGEPLLSLKFDAAEGRLHIVRGLLCHVWEGYDSGGGVILSRETTRWMRELTGTIILGGDLLDELACQVYHAVVGASRLPLTSSETPLPAFSLGRLEFVPGCQRETPSHSWRELFDSTKDVPLNPSEKAKRLETMLHSVQTEEIDELARLLSGSDALAVLKRMFNEVSLSPWTDLTEKTLSLIAALERQGYVTETEAADFLSERLLQTVRHLTAYDLITFHHRGANYPDALLLDAVLKEYLRRIEAAPALFEGNDTAGQRRLRALRQAWMQRRTHEGLPVPDAPTSPGENQRVLPPPYARVPEEQILQPLKRRLLLHDGDPLRLGPRAADILQQSLSGLSEPVELLELGLALFLDRPLGVGKAPGEPDRTVLLSHRVFSRSIARRRLSFLMAGPHCEAALDVLEVKGIPLAELVSQPRPGAVSLADARQVAEDFIVLRTTASTVQDLFCQYDFGPWDELKREQVLIVPRTDHTLTIFDSELKPRLELTLDASEGYVMRAGHEMLRAGLRLPDGSRAPPSLAIK